MRLDRCSEGLLLNLRERRLRGQGSVVEVGQIISEPFAQSLLGAAPNRILLGLRARQSTQLREDAPAKLSIRHSRHPFEQRKQVSHLREIGR